MNTVDDRHLEEITRLAWSAGPRAARREQAIAVRELAAAIRRWARGTRSDARSTVPEEALKGTA